MDVYPDPEAGVRGKYRETSFCGNRYLVCYRDDLDAKDVADATTDALATLSVQTPLCCPGSG